MDLWRQYRACELLHCTPTELDEQPAETIDWFLAFDGMVSELREAASNG